MKAFIVIFVFILLTFVMIGLIIELTKAYQSYYEMYKQTIYYKSLFEKTLEHKRKLEEFVNEKITPKL